MTMSKKDFELIATSLLLLRPDNRPVNPYLRETGGTTRPSGEAVDGQWEQWAATVKQFATALKGTNPRFDDNRFLRAAGHSE